MASQATQLTPLQNFARGEKIDAIELLRQAAQKHNIRLEVLVAATALWANPEVHRRLLAKGSAAYFPDRRRYRAGQGETRGQRLGSLTLDDNSYANRAIKLAVGIDRHNLIGFEAAHIWPRTCYDERCHTAIANLVLLPRALAGLTDHHPEVQRALQYRAFVLYGWYPEGALEPTRPDPYPSTWLTPLPAPQERWQSVTRDESDVPSSRALPGRFDVFVNGRAELNLSKRATMIRLVKALVAMRVGPEEIASAAGGVSAVRLFRRVPGELRAHEFLAAIDAERQAQGKPSNAKRFFCEADELIQFAGWTYALTNQWGPWTAGTIAEVLRAFPDYGVVVRARGIQTPE
jgi:hypothetical protein